MTLQTPLKEIVVCHPSQEYLDDVKSLSQYIEEELNVQEVVCTTDEKRCGVQWRLDADFAVIGKKLRKDLPKVKNALPNVTSEEAKAYLANGKITVAGVELVAGDLTAALFVEGIPASDGGSDYENNTDREVVVLLDCLVRPEYVDQALARELGNKIQKARKEAKLQATDDVDAYVSGVGAEAEQVIGRLLSSQTDVIARVLRRHPMERSQKPDSVVPVWETTPETAVEVGDFKMNICLVKL